LKEPVVQVLRVGILVEALLGLLLTL